MYIWKNLIDETMYKWDLAALGNEETEAEDKGSWKHMTDSLTSWIVNGKPDNKKNDEKNG